MGFWDTVGGVFGVGSGDPNNYARNQIQQNAQQANALGQQGALQYGAASAGMNNTANYLTNIANGNNSVSAQQLKQGLQQGQAQQQSVAASASPNDAAMAARNAAVNMQQMAVGSIGQQAIAGQQERNAAAGQLAQLYGTQAQTAVGAAGAGYGDANQGYGQSLANPQKTWGSLIGGAIGGAAGALGGMGGSYGAGGMGGVGSGIQSGGGSMYGFTNSPSLGGALWSDARLKKDVKPADAASKRALGKLSAHSYGYKDPRHGAGRFMGPMAQDIERAGIPGVVRDTPQGKMVHTGRLSLANTAMLASVDRRLTKLEASK